MRLALWSAIAVLSGVLMSSPARAATFVYVGNTDSNDIHVLQMDRAIDSVGRQATISAIATFIGDIFAHPSHFPPQWAEPVITAAVSAGI